ncbi:MAG: phage holin family protein [Phycisphaerales bacterium]|jgi:hypothetical protein
MADQPSLGSLISNVVRDAKTLLNAQVALTKTEAQQAGQQVAVVSVFGIIALTGLSMAGLFGLIALAFGIAALGLPVWAGFLIVTGILLLLAIIAGLVAKVRSGKITGLTVAQKEWKATTDAVSQAMGRPSITE